MLTRRRFVQAGGAGGAAGLAAALAPAWARGQGLGGPGLEGSGHAAHAHGAVADAAGPRVFDLRIGRTPISLDGRAAAATTINGGLPGPLLRWREGEEAVINVTNALDETTSIHWHGLLLPNAMDGVPGVTFDGIAPGETFRYRFPIRQSGTYWYHSHSGFQEQTGVYGPIVIDPAGPPPSPYDREHVIVLSDWSFLDPARIFALLKKRGHYFNFQKPTVFDFLADARREGLSAAIEARAMWARMRMSRADLADVTGATYSFLMNGQTPDANWTGLFAPGERVRLRVINAAAMTIFDLRIPGLPLSVVSADGIEVRPVETDEIRIAPAETYDVIVTPEAGRAYTVFAEALDRSGAAHGTLAPAIGMAAPIPALRPRPLRGMEDMGHFHDDHGDHGRHADHGAQAGPAAAPAATDHSAHGDHAGHGAQTDHSAHAAPAAAPGPQIQAHDHRMGPGVEAVPEMTMNRLHEPGAGLGADGWRVLTYADLERLDANPDPRPPAREVELHLTGNMERFVWGFDGLTFREAPAPIPWRYGERLRLVLVNDTMMEHPIHLHGMFMELENGAARRPLKHTVNIKPAERMTLLVTADEPGDWAFHCHMLYHMSGMFRVIRVSQPGETDAHAGHEHERAAPASADHGAQDHHHGHGHGAQDGHRHHHDGDAAHDHRDHHDHSHDDHGAGAGAAEHDH